MGNWFVKKIRKHKVMVSIILGLLGFALILYGREVDAIKTGIGISILASAITSFVTFLFLDDDDDYRSVKQWGLEKVYPARGVMNETSDKYLAKTRTLKVMAFGLKSLRDGQGDVVKRILTEGGSVRIITMKPDCRNLQEREADENEKISDSIRGLIAWSKTLEGDIQIRWHDHLPQMFLMIMDNRVFTGPYEYDKDSQQTISFEYNSTGDAFHYYSQYFDRLWNDERFCSPVE